MQALISGRKVEDDSRKDAILEVMSDKYCRAILEISMEKPKSAMEISAETRIPISTGKNNPLDMPKMNKLWSYLTMILKFENITD